MKALVLSAIIVVWVTGPAFAYLDPGTGSIILQGLLAAIASGLFVLKLYWQRFLQLIGINKKNNDSTDKNDQES